MMTGRSIYAKAISLISLGALDFGTPFVRMVILARFLNLPELGFASALAATYSTFEQITDIAIYRFVFSSPRAEYENALASAHALSVLRGCVVASLALLAAPAIACVLSLCSDWSDFAWLSAIIFTRSFEHLGPKVAERDYRYGPQFKAGLIGNSFALATLVATVSYTHSHNAMLASLFAQIAGTVVGSHVLADQPYRLRLRSPQFSKAWTFGYPLMFNGLGLAFAGQGDRLMVGALLGLPALGLYSVVLLVVVIPISVLFRIITTVNTAAFYNASVPSGQFEARLRLYACSVPLIASCYALALLGFVNLAIPLAFGAQFAVSRWALVLLSTGAFFKILRTEPYTSLLLHEKKTGKLAVANQSTMLGLLFGAALTFTYRTLEAALIGRLLGEIAGLWVVLYLTRISFRPALSSYLTSLALSLLIVSIASAVILAPPIANLPVLRLGIVGGCALIILLWATFKLPPLLRQGYARRNEATQTEQ